MVMVVVLSLAGTAWEADMAVGTIGITVVVGLSSFDETAEAADMATGETDITVLVVLFIIILLLLCSPSKNITSKKNS